jgi:hypothetical protein
MHTKEFLNAVEEGARDIAGGVLRVLDYDEKRQLLKKLLKHKSCPTKWKGMNPKKTKNAVESLRVLIK